MAIAGSVIALLLACAEIGPQSSSATDVLEQAERAFHAGIEARDQRSKARTFFQAAANHYDALCRQGMHNTDLYRNMGNAYLLAGELPRAILAYRRGLRLSPGDRQLSAHLTFARDKVVYPEPTNLGRQRPDSWPPWLPWVPSWGRLCGVVLLYSLACLAVTRWWMTQRGRSLNVGMTAFVVAVLLGASLIAEEWRDRQEGLHRLVVIADNGVLLRVGNGPTYPERFTTPLNRGVEARLLFVRGDWLKIELAAGETGWVPRAKVLLDAP